MDPNQPSYPTPGPAAPTPTAYPLQPRRKKGNRLVLIGAVGGLFVLIVIVIAVVALTSDKSKSPTTPTQEHEQTVDPEGPQPATAVDTEQTNNAISQDITSVNDDKDLPATQWDDRTIGL